MPKQEDWLLRFMDAELAKSRDRNPEEIVAPAERKLDPIPLQEITTRLLQVHSETRFEHGWFRDRGIDNVLRDKDQGNYSQLGEFSGQSAEGYLAALPPDGVTYFEFAVGLSTFLAEMKKWRPQWHFIGADLFRQSAHYPFDFIQTNILFLLQPAVRGLLPERGCDVISCTALFHHLTDQLLALANLLFFLKVGGRGFISTLPRPMYPSDNGHGDALDNKVGEPVPRVHKDLARYAGKMISPVTQSGELLFPAEFWSIMNQWNPGWHFEYGVVNYDSNSVGYSPNPKMDVSGRVVVERRTEAQLRVDWLFYALESGSTGRGNVLIVARDESERVQLGEKYISLAQVQEDLSTQQIEIPYDQEIYEER